ncbi:MAG: arginine decarboxylase [Pseudomonadota bacterium]
MKNTYADLIDQSYYFPQEGFDLHHGYLTFHGISLKNLIAKYGTPLRLFYLPKIGSQIKKARNLFHRSIRKNQYGGNYHYAYCTKCNHFSHVLNEVLKDNLCLETSAAFDIDLILNLYRNNKINQDEVIIHNGYKTEQYLDKIVSLQQQGFSHQINVLDNTQELNRLEQRIPEDQVVDIGIRMAIDEAPQSDYYTSRLGIKKSEILNFYQNSILKNPKFRLKMLHFFIDSGIDDTMYYWGEFRKALELYVKLKKVCPELHAFNLGGGFPIRNHLGFEYDYEYIINEIVSNIKQACLENHIAEPDIYTEFGKYTVGESGAIIFQVLETKKQNDAECWYMIDNSLMNTIPDAWSMDEKFILLPINQWDKEYVRASVGGISCDHADYYNAEDFDQEVVLPRYSQQDKEPLYLGFFHTGAYQDAISGYGGIKHCLIPTPKQVIIDRDETGNLIDFIYSDEQTANNMLKLLGYSV